MRRILILDDDPRRHRLFAEKLSIIDRVHVWTADQALMAIRENRFSAWFLDHDLGELGPHRTSREETWNSGTEFARSVNLLYTSLELGNPRVVIHSHNPVGAAHMAKLLGEVGFTVVLAPFTHF